jgi:hypothetical protein
MATATMPEQPATPEPAIDAGLAAARHLRLLGLPEHFDGWGGRRISDIPTIQLRRARAYYATRTTAEPDDTKKALFAGQVCAIDRVLDDRWSAIAGARDAAIGDATIAHEDPLSPMVLGRRIAAILTHPVLVDQSARAKVRAYLDKSGGSAANLAKRIDSIATRLKIAV